MSEKSIAPTFSRAPHDDEQIQQSQRASSHPWLSGNMTEILLQPNSSLNQWRFDSPNSTPR